MIEPSRGKWWNDAEGKWILTKLDEEQAALLDIPDDDDDILGDAKKAATDSTKPPGTLTASKVADTAYYDALEIAPDAEPSKIKRQYYCSRGSTTLTRLEMTRLLQINLRTSQKPIRQANVP